MEDQLPEQAESDFTCLVDQRNGNQMIKQLLNLVISKHCDLSPCRRLPLVIFDLLATDKSRYFAQLGSRIVNY